MEIRRMLNDGSQAAAGVSDGFAGGIAPAGGPIDTVVVTGNAGSISYGDFSGGIQSPGLTTPRVGGGGVGGSGGVHPSSAKHDKHHKKDNDPSNDPVWQSAKQEVQHYEGFSAHGYRDSKGKMTVGRGHMIKSRKQFDKLPWIDSTTGKLATKNQKKDAWRIIMNFHKGDNNYGAPAYSHLTNLVLSNSEINNLFDQDFNKAINQSASLLGQKTWNRMPQPAKNAYIDMVFNIGIGRVSSYGDMNKAIREGNYVEAARQSHIMKTPHDRNSYNYDQFMAASK